ncbi:MAG TPA: circularly permuted type 2 ATP-grasp protein [Polyangiaceae bacterium]|nr:circularly permuted type 2 ATP-grasp protein [Polyangiaceae bacterium]
MPAALLTPGYAPPGGRYDEACTPDGRPRPHWARVAQLLADAGEGEFARRARTVRRAVEQDGVTYNIYADPKGKDRPWALDQLPLVLGADEWRKLSRGVAQRARLLDAVLADLYGPGRLLAEGLLPPALVYGHHNYLWPCRGVTPPGGVYLHLYGCDVARSPDGHWWVMDDRTQGPSGAGYALQNRLIVAPLYGGAFRAMGVQRLSRFFRTLQQELAALAPAGDGAPTIALLTPGPLNETYFEHVLLARYLGFALVEGSDLTVRGKRLYLKTLRGLHRVHVLLRRLDDEYCDPAELRSDSALGVPGLLAAARAGNVLVANALGSGVLEGPGVQGFLPGICRALLGEELALPSVATWWCGEPPALDYVAEHVPELVIKAAFPSMGLGPTFGHALDRAGRAQLVDRLRATPHAYVAQEWVKLSQAPTWSDERGRFEPRMVGLRLYAVATPDGYQVMPGGLTRVAPHGGAEAISMQRGGSSKDTWVLGAPDPHWESLLQPRLGVRDLARGDRFAPSRAAENLFWMGRYEARLEGVARLLRTAAARLVEGDPELADELEVLVSLCEEAGVRETSPGGAAGAADGPNPDEWLLAAAFDPRAENGVVANTSRLHRCAAQLRERISVDNWHTVQQLARPRERPPEGLEAALGALDRVVSSCTALAGYALDDMTRDEAWRFLVTGRRLERLAASSAVIARVLLRPEPARTAALGALLEIQNSSITYRARYQRQPELLPVLDLLVLDESNPHAVCFQLDALAREVDELEGQLGFRPESDPRARLEALRSFDLGALDEAPPASTNTPPASARAPAAAPPGLAAAARALADELAACERFAYALSDELARRFFVHADTLTPSALS